MATAALQFLSVCSAHSASLPLLQYLPHIGSQGIVSVVGPGGSQFALERRSSLILAWRAVTCKTRQVKAGLTLGIMPDLAKWS